MFLHIYKYGASGVHKELHAKETELEVVWILGDVECEGSCRDGGARAACNSTLLDTRRRIGRIVPVDRETELGNGGAKNPAGWFDPWEAVLETCFELCGVKGAVSCPSTWNTCDLQQQIRTTLRLKK